MPVGIETWITEIPPITRWWSLSAVALSVLVQCQVFAPLQLYFSFKSTFGNTQPWRMITTFLYFGSLSIDTIFHLFFFMRYSRMLEESSFANRQADYLWLLILSAALLLVISPILTSPFLAHSLAFVPIYFWSRDHPSVQVSVFGLLTITAPYLPVILIAMTWVISGGFRGSTAGDVVGCFVAHIGWFLRNVWAREAMGGYTWATRAPLPLRRLLGEIQ